MKSRHQVSYGAPFLPPQRRPVAGDNRHRLLGWCSELLPGVVVEIEEWVGADCRQPLHTVLFSFPETSRPPLEVHAEAEKLTRSELVAALRLQHHPRTLGTSQCAGTFLRHFDTRWIQLWSVESFHSGHRREPSRP